MTDDFPQRGGPHHGLQHYGGIVAPRGARTCYTVMDLSSHLFERCFLDEVLKDTKGDLFMHNLFLYDSPEVNCIFRLFFAYALLVLCA
jgi:hypothetical protein